MLFVWVERRITGAALFERAMSHGSGQHAADVFHDEEPWPRRADYVEELSEESPARVIQRPPAPGCTKGLAARSCRDDGRFAPSQSGFLEDVLRRHGLDALRNHL